MELLGVWVETGETKGRNYQTGAWGDCVWANLALPFAFFHTDTGRATLTEDSYLTRSRRASVAETFRPSESWGRAWAADESLVWAAGRFKEIHRQDMHVSQHLPIVTSCQLCVCCFRKPNKSGDLITLNYLIRELFMLQIITLINQRE